MAGWSGLSVLGMPHFFLISHLLLLLAVPLIAPAQSLAGWPDCHTYFPVDVPPEVENFVEIRRRIGYPARARAQQLAGKVRLRVLVDAEGMVRDWVLTTRVHPLLDAAVEAQAMAFRFSPAQRDGQPLAYWTNLSIAFDPHHRYPRPQAPRYGWRRPAPSQRLLAQGLARYAAEDYQAAFVLLQAGLRRHPHRATDAAALIAAYQACGRAAAQLDRWEVAALNFSHAIAWARSSPSAEVAPLYLDRAMARISLGTPQAARSDCQQALLHGAGRAAYCRRGITFFATGQYAEALTDFQTAIDLAPDHPEAYYYKGLILARLQGEVQACTCLDQALAYGLEGIAAEQVRTLQAGYCHGQAGP